MKFPIYLDYSAPTPVDPRVAQKMIPFLTEQFGNAASRSHAFGWEAEKAVEEAREHVAALLNADPKEIIWTSGATEGNNLAIKGAANFYKGKGKHIVTMKTEHKAVLDTVRELERQGFEATYLDPEQNGLLDLEKSKAAATSGACARGRCRPTRSSAWARRSVSRSSRWRRRASASEACATGCSPASRTWKRCTSTATCSGAYRETSTSASTSSRANP